jgi:hypothetical protein
MKCKNRYKKLQLRNISTLTKELEDLMGTDPDWDLILTKVQELQLFIKCKKKDLPWPLYYYSLINAWKIKRDVLKNIRLQK